MNTLETLQNVLSKQYGLDRERLATDADLASLGVDSLGMIELMFLIEDEFHISLPDDKLPVLVTIRDVVDYIDQLRIKATRDSGTQMQSPALPDQ